MERLRRIRQKLGELAAIDFKNSPFGVDQIQPGAWFLSTMYHPLGNGVREKVAPLPESNAP